MKRTLALFAVLCAFSPLAQGADDIDALQNLIQPEFRSLSEDLGAALSYKALTPAEPLGVTGFDIGLEVTATRLEHDDLFDSATGGSGLSTLPVPKVHLHKGLPLNLDVGLFYGGAPNTNIRLSGAEVRYAFHEGGVMTPAVALRGTYTKLGGVGQMDLDTKGLELTFSKGIAMVTPYAGIGRVWVTSTPNDIIGFAGEKLSEESFHLNKYSLGANFNLGLINLAVEGDKTGDATSYGAKFGWRF